MCEKVADPRAGAGGGLRQGLLIDVPGFAAGGAIE